MEQIEQMEPDGMMMSTSDPYDLVLPAFARALAAVENVTKTQEADAGKYKYKYADLGDVLGECKRAMELFGLVMHQPPSYAECAGQVLMTVRTIIYHPESGQWITWPPLGMKLPTDPQAYGSALTYARRYAALAVFNIAPEDDDGRDATNAVRNAGQRTAAEIAIRNMVGDMPVELQQLFVKDFRAHFHSSLSELPTNKHNEALNWAESWQPPDPDTPDGEGATGGVAR